MVERPGREVPLYWMKCSDRIHIGTAGWHYQHWKGPFYPAEMPSEDFLGFYLNRFHCVEINHSFYRLPKPETLKNWREQTPTNFIFTVKASRYITHMKKLKDPQRSLPPLLDTVKALGSKLGPILFQLPPHWRVNVERLDAFLARLPGEFRYAFEFRDPSWFSEDIYAILKRYSAAFCIYHLAGRLSPLETTTDFVYVRLHGPGAAYQGQYDRGVLADWAKRFENWAGQGKEVFSFFDNDEAGYAAQDADHLQALMTGKD